MGNLSAFEMTMIIIATSLTWLIIVLGVVEVAKILRLSKKSYNELFQNFLNVSSQLQKLQTINAEMLKEQRRTSRLIADLSDLKRAEMTGEFEIVEETIEVDNVLDPTNS